MRKMLLLFIMLVVFPIGVKAETNEVSIICGDGGPGDVVDCTISAVTDYAVFTFSADINLGTGLEISGFESSYDMNDVSNGKIDTIIDDKAGSFVIGVLTLKISSDIEVDFTTFKLSNIVFMDKENEKEHFLDNDVQANIRIVRPIVPVTYTASFNSNGGKIDGETTKSCTLEEGKTSCFVKVPTATLEGKVFKGWGTDKKCTNGETNSVDLSSNIEYYACWVDEPKDDKPTEPITYTVTFRANGGKVNGESTKSCTLVNGKTSCSVTVPTAIMEGKIFKGWGINSNCTSGVTDRIDLSSNIEYYACFEDVPKDNSDNDKNQVNNNNNDGNSQNSDNKSDKNEIKNPNTGQIPLIVVFVVMIGTVIFAHYFYNSIKKENI